MGKNKFLLLMGTSYRISIRYIISLSFHCREMLVDFISPWSSFTHIDRSTMLTFAPKSHKLILKHVVLMTQGIKKLLWSFYLGGSLLLIVELEFAIDVTITWSFNLCLLDRISLRNFAYEDIWDKNFVDGMLIWRFFSNYTNFLNCAPILVFANLCRNWIGGL